MEDEQKLKARSIRLKIQFRWSNFEYKNLLLIFDFFICILEFKLPATRDWETKLQNELFLSYNAEVHPRRNSTTERAISVLYDVQIIRILNVVSIIFIFTLTN